MNFLPLIVIVGPTASGKTDLALQVAREFNGEIISADSRAIYKGLDIATAKPTATEQREIVHWGIDLASPGQTYTVSDFQKYAVDKIADIRRRNKLPILVGGTGLYIDSIIYEYKFPPVDNSLRLSLEQETLDELHKYCSEHNITLPENYKNKRYVINTILRKNSTVKRRAVPLPNTIVVGIATEKKELRQRIEERSYRIMSEDTVNEAVAVSSKYGWDNEAMKSNAYPLIRKYLNKELDLEEARSRSCVLDWHLAKRQLTWLKRNKHIWWGNRSQAYTYIARHLTQSNNL